ncbi:DUF4297 domain-containing protein [Burkholderia multivorans]|uniref:dsDNA nuclease domain-containing protein n=1 Tax=Burkholderia multivorans TaxID=87883 RepID=UPI001C2508D8|nr:dsDNA nuclease domain-containing protein [Burkholderia multivorans]MBU9205476.1 DUF4297 domain-containing protein [Burkholderia multivorans]MCO8353486.1 DUF4297 domain-containing protein [Burkholderia multivorans]MCO8385745.1 DUF4297 domain-containing protein [Burkholderia multivorans]MCO8406574.1 DUF4297 domain-containing protein [Burkholderia multivorans]MCO8434841.1 DUF4297 domain-containing protein [Burkholderia multivorans]
MSRRKNSTSYSGPGPLEALLRDLPHDESGGRSATLGFSFQQWWATLSAVERLQDAQDFAILSEFKEDVAILDSAEAPKSVEFCQVKKSERSGAWTLAELQRRGVKLKTGEGYEPSILAKLYRRKVDFEGHPTGLHFISNVAVKLPDESGGDANAGKTCLHTLTDEQKEKVRASVGQQLGLEPESVDLTCVYVHRTNLPLGEQEIFVGGKLSELAASGKLPFTLTHTTIAARMLASEFQRRASDTAYARSFADLKARLLSRAQVIDILSQVAQARPPVHDVFARGIEELEREQYAFFAREEIRSHRVRVCAEATDRTNEVFREIANALAVAKAKVLQTGSTGSLKEVMEEIVQEIRANESFLVAGHPVSYLRAIALLVLTDGIELDVRPPAPGA